ncbi:MAG: hypothetical protein CMJ18_16270 [Phycisphaeraceae bacterium]|nr:hypothetical protein [Phycisphaeraceae bacterium]
MNTRLVMKSLLMLLVSAQLVMTGCLSEESRARWNARQAKPAPAPAPRIGNSASMSFPSAVLSGAGEKDCCAKVVLEKSGPSEVMVGEEFEYTVKAVNRGNVEVRDVVITDVLPGNFSMSSSSPAASGNAGGKTMWNMGNLSPGESATLVIKGKAAGAGKLVNCTTVDYTPYICIATNVVQPALELTKKMTPEVLLCEPIVVEYTVTNSGTGAVRNVVIKDQLPDGLVTQSGKSTVVADVGTLQAGERKAFKSTLKATRAGTFDNKAVATGAGGLTDDATASTTVREPALSISKTGPEKLFLGRTATYQIKVSNTGDGDARNARVEDPIPSNVTFVSASDGGSLVGNKVVWSAGTLKPGDSRTYSLKVKAASAGNVVNEACAMADCAKKVCDSTKMVIAGIPAILLEVIDIDDPIEVGANETYVITVTNQGSAPGTNIKIVASLEDSMQYVSSSGDTGAASHAGGKVTFKALASLAPKAKATFKVVVKAVSEDDARFGVSLTSDQLRRPVEETESTHYYE